MSDKIGPKERHQMVRRFVKPEKLRLAKERREQNTFLAMLLKRYPDVAFWRAFDPCFQVRSLLWWRGGGKADLERAYNAFRLDFEPKPSIVGDKKLGNDVIVNRKPTLREWL